jgi:hypothetical protein
MPKILFLSLIIAFLLTSCASPLFAPATPTVTSTLTPLPTVTLTPTPTLTPSPTATHTPTPTDTAIAPILSVSSRDEFSEMVKAGLIKCQGVENGSNTDVLHFFDEATAAGIVSKSKYMLGSGIPSADDPSQCLFLMTFIDGNTVIIYKDRKTGEFVKLPVVE